MLTSPPENLLEGIDCFEDEDRCRQMLAEKFPTLKLVVTGYPSKRTTRISAQFAQIVGYDLERAIPGLIQIMGATDRHLRRLALMSIRTAGIKASKMVPLLAEHFYFGPWVDDYLVEGALTEAGPTGLEVLNRMAQWQEPRFRHLAQVALRSHAHRLANPIHASTTQVRPEKPVDTKVAKKRRKWGFAVTVGYYIAIAGVFLFCLLRFGFLWAVAALIGLLLLIVIASTVSHMIPMLWRQRKYRRERNGQPPK
jgi:hypothetical protein